MDLLQLLLLWFPIATCIGHPYVLDYSPHRHRLEKLRQVEERVEGRRYRKPHPGGLRNGSAGAELQSVRLDKERGCGRSFSCPRSMGEGVPCIEIRDLCDGIQNCPRAEDEDPVSCLFFKMTTRFVSTTLENAIATKHRHRSFRKGSDWQ